MTRVKVAYFAALMLVALELGPSLAHLLALPNKIGLDEEAYFAVQGIYSGWALLAVLVIAGLLATLTLAVLLRGHRRPMAWAIAAFLCLVAAQALFWIFTFPANQATANWTEIPADWQQLRSAWEYSHAAGAVLTVLATASLICSLLSWKGREAAPAE
jgi:hypothetical protein